MVLYQFYAIELCVVRFVPHFFHIMKAGWSTLTHMGMRIWDILLYAHNQFVNAMLCRRGRPNKQWTIEMSTTMAWYFGISSMPLGLHIYIYICVCVRSNVKHTLQLKFHFILFQVKICDWKNTEVIWVSVQCLYCVRISVCVNWLCVTREFQTVFILILYYLALGLIIIVLKCRIRSFDNCCCCMYHTDTHNELYWIEHVQFSLKFESLCLSHLYY